MEDRGPAAQAEEGVFVSGEIVAERSTRAWSATHGTLHFCLWRSLALVK